jgi:signal transduction histidine kinase
VLKEKLVTTFLWAAACISAAMLLDFVVSVLILHESNDYTPLATLAIATLVSVPSTYVLVSSRIKLAHARDELAKASETAINANVSKTMFFANMSHELRTPLNAIIGFSELLGADMFASKRTEYARLIRSSGLHLLDLVNDLLEISRMEAGKLQLREEDISISPLVDECIKTIEPRARSARLRIGSEVEPEICDVFADGRALKQILLNLLTNAVKYSEAGGQIEVFAFATPGGEVAIGVRDNGVGIPPEEQPRVFEPFRGIRHDVLNVHESTGLGLPIVKGLAEAHGGRVELRSQVSKGTTVTVWLPTTRVRPQARLAFAS